MASKRCSVCGQPMKKYVTGWKCTNIKAHDAAKRNPNKPGQVRNPGGRNKTSTPGPGSYRRRRGTPPKPGGRQARWAWVLTACPRCGNGKYGNPWTCGTCNKYGRTWTIK